MSLETQTVEEGQQVIEKRSHLSETTKKELEWFINDVGNTPGLPYEEQLKLREKSEHTQDPIDIKNYEDSKLSKFRANSLSTPLVMGQAFLTRAPEAKNIAEQTKTDLINRIKIVSENIRAKSASYLISQESVDEVVDIANSILLYINQVESR